MAACSTETDSIEDRDIGQKQVSFLPPLDPNHSSGEVKPQAVARRRDRLLELSRPKTSKGIWITTFGPRVVWGTQDLLWPVSYSAKKAQPSDRICSLATPKTDFQVENNLNRLQFEYSCGRASVIWPVEKFAKSATSSERVIQLAAPKTVPDAYQDDRPSFVFSCGRSSPIWAAAKGDAKSGLSDRLTSLSHAKVLHPDFIGNRQVETITPAAALKAHATERLEYLATPKTRREDMFREPQWPVSAKAKSALASNRCTELAKPKALADGYSPCREVVWQVSRGARSAHASPRIDELSRPIVRASMDHVQFDPQAFLVKETALKGRCSRRVEELAQPIQR